MSRSALERVRSRIRPLLAHPLLARPRGEEPAGPPPLPAMYAPILAEAEEAAGAGAPIGDVLAILRRLPLDDFGQLMFHLPDEGRPALSRALPAMAPEAVQREWTGNHGMELLRQSTGFVRSVRHFGMALTGAPLDGRRIMDFGCGYGRMLRLMLHVTDPDRLHGVDAWERSLRHCREAGLPNPLAASEAVPRALPFADRPFALIFSFSVFTHLSPRAAGACLAAMRGAVAPDGLAAITFRPVEYWAFHQGHHRPRLPDATLAEMRRLHERRGIAYLPHRRPPGPDGEVHYGDTSMSLEHLASLPGWRLAAIDRQLGDPLQPIAYLRPA